MQRALIIVDYQYDFVSDDGALTVGKKAKKIENNILEKLNFYNKDDIYFTLDTHYEDDFKMGNTEGKIFDKHCIYGTKGHSLYGELNNIKVKESNYFKKSAYCPKFEDIKMLISKYNHIEICGVVTDICVLQTLIGLYTYSINNNKNTKFTVDKKCCASFNLEREKWALDYMKSILNTNIK